MIMSVFVVARILTVLSLISAASSTGNDECTSSNSQCYSNQSEPDSIFIENDLEYNLNSILKKQRQFYINGSWVDPISGYNQDTIATPTLPVINPSTAKPIAHISLASRWDVNLAVQSSKEALEKWSIHTTPQQRIRIIEVLLEKYRTHSVLMAQLITMEMGAPIDMSLSDQVGSGDYVIQQFLKELERFEFEYPLGGTVDVDEPRTTIFMDPVGVVACITPWNWPLNQIALKVIPALATGNTVILKPSELSPLSALLFAQLLHEAGVPPGVFNLINGGGHSGAGEFLTTAVGVDMVSFTGSTRAGAEISKAAADTFKRVSLELGGKGANIIFADAVVRSSSGSNDDDDDGYTLEEIIADGVYSCMENSGQSCNAPTRMLVEESIYEEAVEIAARVAKSLRVDSGMERGDHLGPVVSQDQYDRIQGYIQKGLDEGARLVAGGLGQPANMRQHAHSFGYYVQPTVFADVLPTMTIARHEIFGPVLSILKFTTGVTRSATDEAIAMANDTPYGLANYVYSTDPARLRKCARMLRSGMVELNGVGLSGDSPFGGMKASGNGREGGRWGLEEFCEVKAVSGL